MSHKTFVGPNESFAKSDELEGMLPTTESSAALVQGDSKPRELLSDTSASKTPEGAEETSRSSFFKRASSAGVPLALHQFAYFLAYAAMQDLVLRKACLLHFRHSLPEDGALSPSEACANGTLLDDNDAVQTRASMTTLYYMGTMSVLCLVSNPVLGSLSDILSQRMGILLPLAPFVLGDAWLVLQALRPLWPPEAVVVTSAVFGVAGGFFGLVGLFYAAATRQARDKAERINLVVALTGCYGVGSFAGYSSVGLLTASLGRAGCLAVALASHVLVGLVSALLITGPPSGTGELRASKLRSYYADMFRTIGARREWGRRRMILVLLAVYVVFITAAEGSLQIQYYYLKASVGISLGTNGLLQGLKSVAVTAGAVLLYPLLSRRVSEVALFLIGVLAFVGSRVCVALAPSAPWAFASLAFEVWYGFAITAFRSLLSECVGPDEQGKISSTVAFFDGVASLLATLTFNFLFPATLDVFLPASYVVMVLLCVFPVAGLLYLHRLKRRIKTQAKKFSCHARSP